MEREIKTAEYLLSISLEPIEKECPRAFKEYGKMYTIYLDGCLGRQSFAKNRIDNKECGIGQSFTNYLISYKIIYDSLNFLNSTDSLLECFKIREEQIEVTRSIHE